MDVAVDRLSVVGGGGELCGEVGEDVCPGGELFDVLREFEVVGVVGELAVVAFVGFLTFEGCVASGGLGGGEWGGYDVEWGVVTVAGRGEAGGAERGRGTDVRAGEGECGGSSGQEAQ